MGGTPCGRIKSFTKLNTKVTVVGTCLGLLFAKTLSPRRRGSGQEHEDPAAIKADLLTLNVACDAMLATNETTVAGGQECQDAAERISARLNELKVRLAGGEEAEGGGPPSPKRRTVKLWLECGACAPLRFAV